MFSKWLRISLPRSLMSRTCSLTSEEMAEMAAKQLLWSMVIRFHRDGAPPISTECLSGPWWTKHLSQSIHHWVLLREVGELAAPEWVNASYLVIIISLLLIQVKFMTGVARSHLAWTSVQSSFSTVPTMPRLKILKCSLLKMNGLNCVEDSKTWPQSQMFS